jgi:hypothetical protein
VRSEEARVLLLDRAQRYGRAAARLRAATAARGRVHRAAAAPVATRIGPADEAEVLAECEERESAVVVVFRDALEGRLPAALHGLIAAEFELLLGSLGSLAAVRERAVRQRRFFVGEPG